MKECSKCKQQKPKAEFYKRTKAVDGLQSYCKECKKTLRKEYYKEIECTEDSTEIRRERQRTDHYTPVSKGGIHSITNVVWSCATCNCQKHDKILDSPLSKIHIEELNKLLSETSLN